MIFLISPWSFWGDHFVAFFDFVISHRRSPTNKLIFNDVLYRLKANGEICEPLRIKISDKELVKEYIAEKVGDKFNVPTLAVLRSINDLVNFKFPESCCIKPTHASGYVFIRKNKEIININLLRSWFQLDYYLTSKERNYKYLQRKILLRRLYLTQSQILISSFFVGKGR